MSVTELSLPRVRVRRETALLWAVVIVAELLALLVYAAVGTSTLVDPLSVRYWLYPLIWINVSLWAVLGTSPAPAATRHRRLAALLATGYFGVLAYAGGLVGPGQADAGLRVVTASLPPGWGPALLYTGGGISLTLFPFKVVGYLSLSYLVYATALDAARNAVTGLLGLLSCVSCTWPVLASLVTGVVGSGTALAGAVFAGSYGLSTVVFVITVGLLYWRPFAGSG